MDGPMGALMAMIQRAGEQPGRRRGARMIHRPPEEGPATPEERQLLREAADQQALAELQAAVAIDAARCVHTVHEALGAHAAGVGLPPEIAAAVVRAAVTVVDDAARRRLCGCALIGTGRHSLHWEGGTTDCGKAGAGLVCAHCGKLVHATVWPRVRQPGGEPCPVGGARISAGTEPAAWKQCRHFHIEGGSGTVAVRHRMSGLHSFRTVVAAEWVFAGAVTYELTLQTAALPGAGLALGIGMVTPSAQVNSDVAWAPGTRDWAHAWGLCIEGRPGAQPQRRAAQAGGEDDQEEEEEDEDEEDGRHDNQIRAIETPWFCGGRGATVDAPRFCPALSEGTRFRVTIDATKRSLRVCAVVGGGEQQEEEEEEEQLCGELWLQGEEAETEVSESPLYMSSSDEDEEEEEEEAEEGDGESAGAAAAAVHAVGKAPFALALALKFAGDEVSFVRCE
jgi:hypothetical protein